MMTGLLARAFAVSMAVATGLALIGCADHPVGPAGPADEAARRAWSAFEEGDLEQALAGFQSALAWDSTFAEAHTGGGWCLMRLNSLENAAGSFERARLWGAPSPDVYAGECVVYRDLEPADFHRAQACAESVLAWSPRYVFAHDAAFDWMDLRLTAAQSLFAQGKYREAKAQVDSLGGALLNPDVDTFVSDLLAEIQRLGQQIR